MAAFISCAQPSIMQVLKELFYMRYHYKNVFAAISENGQSYLSIISLFSFQITIETHAYRVSINPTKQIPGDIQETFKQNSNSQDHINPVYLMDFT